MSEIETDDDLTEVSRPKTLDDFRTWGDVHSGNPSGNDTWITLTREGNREDVDAAMARLDEHLVQQFLDDAIPPKDRFADLKTLQPSAKSQMPVVFQTRILDAMHKQDLLNWRARRKVYGWAFFGPSGWSKSTLCTAWFAQYARANAIDINQMYYHHSLREMIEFPKSRFPQCMWRMNALTLIEENLAWQHRDFTDKNAKQPRVSSAWIQALTSKVIHPCLYLEEVDKVRTDKTKLDILFDTIDALYNYEGVLLLNSNLTKQEFANQFGPEFARRISEMCNVVDCFAQEIKLC
jgi:hypothetical protein